MLFVRIPLTISLSCLLFALSSLSFSNSLSHIISISKSLASDNGLINFSRDRFNSKIFFLLQIDFLSSEEISNTVPVVPLLGNSIPVSF